VRSLNLFGDARLDSINSQDRAELYSLSAMVYSAINFRALNVSQIPLRVISPEGKPITSGTLPRIFSRQHGFVDQMRRAELSYCTFGYTLFHKLRNAMQQPIGIRWINPTSFMLDADNYRGLQGFRVYASHHQKETGTLIRPHDAVYLNGMDLRDDFDGVAPAEVAFASAAAESELAQTFYAVFRNMAIPAAFIQPTSDYSPKFQPEQATGLARLFRAITQGARNTGRTIISPHRVEIQTLQPPFRDMDTRHISDQVREQVAIAFGIPVELLLPSASNYAQFEGARRTWAHTWLVPHIMWYADGFTAQLASEFGEGWRVEANLDDVPFLKEDMASRVNTVTAQLNAGLITYGVAQKELGLPVIPQLENHLFSASMNAPIPIEQASTLWQTLNGGFSADTIPPLDDETHPFADRPTIGDTTKSWIPDEQYNELRAWKKAIANHGRGYAFEPITIRQDVVEFIEKALEGADDEADMIFANARAWLGQKSIQSTRLDFEGDM